MPVSPGPVQLSAQQRRSLERDGYLMVLSLLDEAAIARMTSRLTELVRQTVAAWAADPGPDIVEPGVVHAKLGLAASRPHCQPGDSSDPGWFTKRLTW